MIEEGGHRRSPLVIDVLGTRHRPSSERQVRLLCGGGLDRILIHNWMDIPRRWIVIDLPARYHGHRRR